MKKIIIALGLTTFFACSAIFATTNAGWYISGQTGYSNFDLPNLSPDSLSQSHFAFGLGGGYNFPIHRNLLLGLELNANYLGKIEETIVRTGTRSGNISSYDFLVTAHYVNAQLDGFIKAGAVRERATAEFNGLSVSYNSDTSGMIAGGMGYILPNNPKIEPFVEIFHIFGGYRNNKPITNTTFLIGLSYHFNNTNTTSSVK